MHLSLFEWIKAAPLAVGGVMNSHRLVCHAPLAVNFG